jgi:hypothetical protein
MPSAPVTSTVWPKSSSSNRKLLLRLLVLRPFTNLLHDERLYPIEFRLKAGREATRAVFEKHDETKGEEDKENDPKKSTQQRHAAKPN